MKKSPSRLIIFVATFAFFNLISYGGADAQQTIKYNCCYQAYKAIEKERIDAFTKETGIKVDVTVVSSSSAYKLAISNVNDISCIALKTLSFQHLCSNFVMTPFCQDGIAIIADPKCAVDNLSEMQLRQIFSADIMNWKELGGANQRILTVVPRKETGAYINFDRMVMKGKAIKYHIKTYESTMVIDVVEHLPSAISFIAYGTVKHRENIKVLKIDNLLPTDKHYPYIQVFYFISAEEPVGAAKAFVDFAFSDTSIEIIKNNEMIPIAR